MTGNGLQRMESLEASSQPAEVLLVLELFCIFPHFPRILNFEIWTETTMLRESQSCGISHYSNRNETMLISLEQLAKRTREESNDHPLLLFHFTKGEIEAKRGEMIMQQS